MPHDVFYAIVIVCALAGIAVAVLIYWLSERRKR